MIHSPPGRGKTCAALALCDHVIRSLYVTAGELTGKVLQSFKYKDPFDWTPFKPIDFENQDHPTVDGASLVVLDELGTRLTVSDTHYEVVQRVLDMRETYPLIVVSNLTPDVIARVYDDRIASRCVAGTVVELKGPDCRAE